MANDILKGNTEIGSEEITVRYLAVLQRNWQCGEGGPISRTSIQKWLLLPRDLFGPPSSLSEWTDGTEAVAAEAAHSALQG